MPKFPGVLVGLIIAGAVPALNYFVNNASLFGIPSAMAPTIVIAVSAVITILQQWKPPAGPVATSRGLEEQPKQKSFAARVLIG
jgi:hypothetical protein